MEFAPIHTFSAASGIVEELQSERLRLIETGHQVLDLSMINPDIAPPRAILDRLIESAMKPANHRYPVSRGIRKLREAFADKYQRAFGVNLDPQRNVCVSMGGKDGMLQSLRLIVSQGDRVLVPSPTYPSYLGFASLLGASPIFYEVSSDESEMLRDIVESVRKFKPRAVILNFPHNPTGICVHQEFYDRLIEETRGLDVFLLNDFVYGELIYDRSAGAASLLRSGAGSGTAEIYSLSKAYSVPGWRVGSVAGDSNLIQALGRLKSVVDYGVFLPIQYAASFALQSQDDPAAAAAAQYEERGRFLASALKRKGWKASAPKAGASVWARLPDSGVNGAEFCQTLLRDKGVLALPGSVFGEKYGDFVRFALVAPRERLSESLQL